MKVCFIAATKNKACEVCINGTVMLIAVGDYRITVHHWCTSTRATVNHCSLTALETSLLCSVL
jgi:hypothetical protein